MHSALSQASNRFRPLAFILLCAIAVPICGQESATLLGHADTRNGFFSFSPEVGLMATAELADARTNTWTITLVSLKTGKPVDTLRFTKTRVWSTAFSADGKTLGWLNTDGQIVLRNLATKTERKIFYREPTPEGRHMPTDSLTLSPNGKHAAINGLEASVNFVDLEAGKLVPGERISEAAREAPILFSPDGRTAYLNPKDYSNIDVYDVASKKKLRTLTATGSTRSCALSPDGTTLAVAEPMHIVLWDVATDKEMARLRITPLLEQGRAHCVAFSADGKTLACGYEHRANAADTSKPMIGFVDAGTGSPLAALSVPGLPRSLSFVADGKSIVSQCGYKNANNVDAYRVPVLKAAPKETAPAADLLVKDSVWVCESPSMVFTILERQGEKFKARIIHSAFDREVTGTIKDGKISWLAKDVQAARGGKGGDNEGTIHSDSTIDFVADGGRVRYTLTLKKDM